MKKLILLFLSSVFFFSCSWPESSTSYVYEEKWGEVLLTDLHGITYKLVCSLKGDEKKCGLIFDSFNFKSSKTDFHMEYSTTTVVTPGFKDASFISIQMTDENTGKAKSLVSYMQRDVPYTNSTTYVPSVMALHAGEEPTEYSASGYFEGNQWIKNDTTIALRDTLFANSKGVIDFTLSDAEGNKAHLVMDVSKLMESNDKKTLNTMRDPDTDGLIYFWNADSASIAVEPIETNFEFEAPNMAVGCRSGDQKYFPFVHLVFEESWEMCTFDASIVNGGVNAGKVQVDVNYAN